jgi:hypothetical protein
MSADRGEWIQTYTGRRFYLADPRPEEVDIRDIAHSLSMQCRYNGHVQFFYSVAQHAVLACRMAPPGYEFEGLNHDDSEAYVSDMTTPLERMCPDYRGIEQRNEQACAIRFGLPWPVSAAVKAVDIRMSVTEAPALMAVGAEPWWLAPGRPPPYQIEIESWSPERAEREFLDEFERWAP